MRRFVDSLIAAALLIVPSLAITVSTATPSAAATNHAHYVAAKLSPNSACAPDDPGTL